jgi:hypothetical protein
MPNRTCPSCLNRLPYASRRCIRCGWTHQEGRDPERVRVATRRRWIVWSAILLLFLTGGSSLLVRNAPALADWYAGFAAERLAQQFSSFAPVATDVGAYFFCARHVARQMDGENSVETFPSPGQSTVQTLGDQRFRIVSFVDQARESGEQVRHEFTCTVRRDQGRWVMEELEVERWAGRSAPVEVVAGL